MQEALQRPLASLACGVREKGELELWAGLVEWEAAGLMDRTGLSGWATGLGEFTVALALSELS